jgi:hypothetical protein
MGKRLRGAMPKKYWLCLFLLVVFTPRFAQGQSVSGWTPLFNGKDLTGWKHVGHGKDLVENGLIRTRGGAGVPNRFGQTHDVRNLYVCDASVFLNCTDKTTTLSILAFSLRTNEHLVEQFRSSEH